MMEGYKDRVIGWIPEDWEIAALSDTGEIISGGTPDTTNSDYWNGTFAWCTPTDITGLKGNRYIKKTERCISEEGLNNSSATLLPENSLVICTRATIGDCAINQVPISTNQGFKSIKPNNDWDVTFLYYFIKANKPILVKLSSGSTFLEISKSSFEKIPIPKPQKSEQSKIAYILSAVDDKIDAINVRITQTQQLKNGLMQQLLTKGIGHTKFKDSPLGEIPENWEVVKLGEITNVCVGKDLLEQNYSPNLSDEYKYPVYSNTVENKGLYGYYNIQEYTGNSVTVIGRGVGVGTAFPRKDSFGAIGRLVVLFPKNGLDEIYLSYTINFCVKFFAESSAIPQLTGAQISKYLITFPPFQEQQKIAEILTSVDEKLDVLMEKKAEYEKLKKGVMQKLLTGQIRVNTTN